MYTTVRNPSNLLRRNPTLARIRQNDDSPETNNDKKRSVSLSECRKLSCTRELLPILRKSQSFITGTPLRREPRNAGPSGLLGRHGSEASLNTQSVSRRKRGLNLSLAVLNLQDKKPLEKFRTIATQVKNALKFMNATTSHPQDYQRITSFAQLQQEIQENFNPSHFTSNSGVFDPSYYKAVKDIPLSQEGVRILSKMPEHRTEEEIQLAMLAMKSSNTAYREYPPKMQREIVSKGWYEQFESKRVIIRQGHQPLNFYLIVAGSAIVSIVMKDKKTGEERQATVALLAKGTSFGELALLHNRTRTATVTCKTKVGLLAVSREDFIKFFEQKDSTKETEHICFLRNLSRFNWLPIGKLNKRMDVCMSHYFRDGAVIDKNLSQSEWIYIVKTGSCRVLAKLLKPKTKEPRRRLGSLPDIQQRHGRRLMAERRSSLRSSEKEIKSILGNETRKEPRSPLPGNVKSPKLRLHRSKNDLATVTNEKEKDKVKSNLLSPPKIMVEEVKKNEELNNNGMEEILKKPIEKPLSADSKVQTIQPEYVFVQMSTLTPGDDFGLAALVHQSEEHDSSYLVSNGGECILLAKSWVRANSDETALRALRSKISPIPTADAMQQTLQTKYNWEHFKCKLIQSLVSTHPFDEK